MSMPQPTNQVNKNIAHLYPLQYPKLTEAEFNKKRSELKSERIILHTLIANGNSAKAVDTYAKLVADQVVAKDSRHEGFSPLAIAVIFNRSKVVEVLLTNNAQ